MKKLLILAWVLFFAIMAQAQKMNFCDALRLLEEEAIIEFENIRLGVDSSVSYPTSYFSKVELMEANSTKITEGMNNFKFEADFGEFATIDEARAKVNELCSKLSACFPGFKATQTTDKIFKSEEYTFSNHTDEFFRLYASSLTIQPAGGKFFLTYAFNASEKQTALNSVPKQAYTDFERLKSPADNSTFSIALRKVIEEAKTAFQNLKAEELPGELFFSNFESNYQIPDYKCFIEDRTMGVVFFVIPKVKSGSSENFNQAVNEAASMIENALGQDYGYSLAVDQQSFIFAHKNQPEKKVVSLELSGDDEYFELGIRVHNLE